MSISATPETPYLRIGESKYGKPALDPIAQPALSLDDGARPCLVALVGTARSNLTVGPPFEVAISPRDVLAPSHRLKLNADSPELQSLTRGWNESRRRTFQGLPPFSWEQGGAMQAGTDPDPGGVPCELFPGQPMAAPASRAVPPCISTGQLPDPELVVALVAETYERFNGIAEAVVAD